MRLAKEAVQDAGCALPVLDIVHAHMQTAVAAGHGEQDWSAMARTSLGSL
nr:hypothetical protein [Herbaspirillum robiniae]